MTDEIRKPPQEIRTDRLLLRSARAGDGVALRAAIAVSLDDFYPWLPFSKALGDQETMERVSKLAEDSFDKDVFYVWRAWEPGKFHAPPYIDNRLEWRSVR